MSFQEISDELAKISHDNECRKVIEKIAKNLKYISEENIYDEWRWRK